MGRKLKKTAKIKPQNIKAELNNFNTNERYLREWSEINKELTLKSNKNIDMATESSKLIYNLINETTDWTPVDNSCQRKRNFEVKGYVSGKGKNFIVFMSIICLGKYSSFFENLTQSINKKSIMPKVSRTNVISETNRDQYGSILFDIIE